ncbi:hypothetical protein ANAPRD1_01398 [Anaplasma phagocytophilum]|nr:hypothetical protein ANAPRD1_01398 [Anaplasma phagocytophilum]
MRQRAETFVVCVRCLEVESHINPERKLVVVALSLTGSVPSSSADPVQLGRASLKVNLPSFRFKTSKIPDAYRE